MQRRLNFLGVVVGIYLLDQISKFIVQKEMIIGQSIPLIENIFHLTYILNPGAAFGMLAHRTEIFVIVSLAAIGLVIAFYRKILSQPFWIQLALALQLSGALGNLTDRLRTGYVVDFLDLRVWPIFNIADMAIVCGVAIFLWEIVFTPEKKGDWQDGRIG